LEAFPDGFVVVAPEVVADLLPEFVVVLLEPPLELGV
jgi:hypothetical protein